MTRLLSICKIAGISLSDLLKANETGITHELRLTPSQQTFLQKNPHYFRYFCKLAVEECTPQQIATTCGLDHRSTMKYLRTLDKIGLIKLMPGERADTGLPSLVSLGATGEIFTREKYHSLAEILNWIKPREREGYNTAPLYYLELHPSTTKELRSELSELVGRYAQRALKDKALHKRENLLKLTFFYGLAERGFVGNIPKL